MFVIVVATLAADAGVDAVVAAAVDQAARVTRCRQEARDCLRTRPKGVDGEGFAHCFRGIIVGVAVVDAAVVVLPCSLERRVLLTLLKCVR